ncbi:hypothetical protein C8J56DRAFT_900450 [Mycena floridula]|nr:hypothetical protein C8J56DRAFT_900450 [Mycena floridula]
MANGPIGPATPHEMLHMKFFKMLSAMINPSEAFILLIQGRTESFDSDMASLDWLWDSVPKEALNLPESGIKLPKYLLMEEEETEGQHSHAEIKPDRTEREMLETGNNNQLNWYRRRPKAGKNESPIKLGSVLIEKSQQGLVIFSLLLSYLWAKSKPPRTYSGGKVLTARELVTENFGWSTANLVKKEAAFKFALMLKEHIMTSGKAF